jgi:hypothetical protein
VQIYLSRSTQQTEQHRYRIIKKFDKFEIRKYDAALFSSVKLNKKGYKESSSEGFRILAGYIFGDNETQEKIAMTSPVVMELGDTSKMMFMVPKNYNLKNLPNPKNSKIVFEKEEEKIIAAIRFDGWADDEKIEKYKTILMNELVKEKLNYLDKWNKKRSALAENYIKSLSKTKFIFPKYDSKKRTSSWYAFVIRHSKRDKLFNWLKSNGIETLIHYPLPPYKQECYSKIFKSKRFPVSDEIHKTCISLPCNHLLSETEQQYIISKLLEFDKKN